MAIPTCAHLPNPGCYCWQWTLVPSKACKHCGGHLSVRWPHVPLEMLEKVAALDLEGIPCNEKENILVVLPSQTMINFFGAVVAVKKHTNR
eukprot:4080066-Amphidinium_carterae.1